VRAISVLLALAWALEPVVSGAHATSERHIYCAEHGAFEDAPPARGAAPIATARPGASTQHLRCAFAPRTAPTQTARVAPEVARAPLAAASRPATPDPRHPPQIPILRRAPKGSPPRTAA
jgi:hypothetical protein